MHGSPLISGLNVKEAGASKWAGGKPGDLRDVWRRAAGLAGEDGNPHSTIGKITTIVGIGGHEEHNLEHMSQQINRLGQHVNQQGGSVVAIYLPNSVETLIAVFGEHPQAIMN